MVDNSVVKLGAAAGGTGGAGGLVVADYFQPYDYASRNPPDMDLGAGGVVLLDDAVFRGPEGESTALQAGKLAKLRSVQSCAATRPLPFPSALLSFFAWV